MVNFDIYKDKKILVTGHTGFKGAWLSIWLHEIGAKVIGFSLEQYDNDYIFESSDLKNLIVDERGDICNIDRLKKIFAEHKPDIVFHLAAQSLVRRSYKSPLETINVNVMGTANILECIRESTSVKAGIMVTTDKCYKNKESRSGYMETDELGGYDLYSISKVCDELIIESYRNLFFSSKLIASARAGNVIGGGDFAEDRIVPDCIRALKKNKSIQIRNPYSVRPWQHVLDVVNGYLLLGKRLLEGDKNFSQAWNFAPNLESVVTVKDIVNLVIEQWGTGRWVESKSKEGMVETKILTLNANKAKKLLGWNPKLDIKEAVKKTVEWYKKSQNSNSYELCAKQIREHMESVLINE